MSLTESIGYLASVLVLATFCMRGMVALRWMAITSNLAFIAYGALAGLGPVLVLHLLLLPVNVLRLASSRRCPAHGDCETDACSPPDHLTVTPHAPGSAPSPWLGRARARRVLACRRARQPRPCSPSGRSPA